MATPTERAVAALRAANVKVVEYPGWKTRMHAGTFTPRAIMFHHDATPAGPTPAEDGGIAYGRSDLPGPLSQFWVDFYGTWHVIANGAAWHAGTGQWGTVLPKDQGNRYSFGVETDHTVNEPWGSAQYTGILKGFAAICKEFGWDPNKAVVGHKEYAPTRKIDPWGIDMGKFRKDVSLLMNGKGDWFSMATAADLSKVVDDRLAWWLPRMAAYLNTGAGNQGFSSANMGAAYSNSLRKAVDHSTYILMYGDHADDTKDAGTHPNNLQNLKAKLDQVLARDVAVAPEVDLDALADKVAAKLTDDFAAKVADLLAARLAA